jgi:hypothetical protein
MVAIMLADASNQLKAVATSSPGGTVARHIRVQFRESSQSPWKRYATCRQREQAERCRAELERRGFGARLVTYRLCPVAA